MALDLSVEVDMNKVWACPEQLNGLKVAFFNWWARFPTPQLPPYGIYTINLWDGADTQLPLGIQLLRYVGYPRS